MKETKGLSTEEKKYLYRSKQGRPGKLDNYDSTELIQKDINNIV
jgi:hypothetical protein